MIADRNSTVVSKVNNQLTDQVNAVGDKSDGDMRSGKGKKCFSYQQEGHSREKCPARDRACRMYACAVLLTASKLNVPRLVSMAVVISDPEGIKVAKVLMVVVDEDIVMQGCKKQTLWLTEIITQNLPDLFSIL